MEPPGGRWACPEREVGSQFVGSDEVGLEPLDPCRKLLQRTKPLQDPGIFPRAPVARVMLVAV